MSLVFNVRGVQRGVKAQLRGEEWREGEKGCGCEEGKWKWKGETQPDATDRILHSHCGLCTHPNRALFTNQLINNFRIHLSVSEDKLKCSYDDPWVYTRQSLS